MSGQTQPPLRVAVSVQGEEAHIVLLSNSRTDLVTSSDVARKRLHPILQRLLKDAAALLPPATPATAPRPPKQA